jgi:hypothetical protein
MSVYNFTIIFRLMSYLHEHHDDDDDNDNDNDNFESFFSFN